MIDFERCRIALDLPRFVTGQLDCLEGNARSAEMRAQYTCDTEEIDPLHFAAYLLHQGAKVRHCLGDGNKRMAWYTTLLVLSEWELGIDATDDDAEAFVLGIADGTTTPEDAIDWIQGHLVELPSDAFVEPTPGA